MGPGMTANNNARCINSYLIQTIHRCNFLLISKAPSRKRLDLITRRLRAAMAINGGDGLTLNQVNLLLAKAYSAATARKFELAGRKANPSWRTEPLIPDPGAFGMDAHPQESTDTLARGVDA